METYSSAIEAGLDETVYQFPFESGRWADLVFNLLNVTTELDPELVYAVVDDLDEEGLLSPATLAKTTDPDDTNAAFIEHILARRGLTDEEIETATALLTDVAGTIEQQYEGYVQRMVRAKGIEIRDEFVASVDTDAVSEADLRIAISTWLQNAFEMPVSRESPAIDALCEELDVEPETLWEIADGLDVTLPIVDEAVELTHLNEEVETLLEELEAADDVTALEPGDLDVDIDADSLEWVKERYDRPMGLVEGPAKRGRGSLWEPSPHPGEWPGERREPPWGRPDPWPHTWPEPIRSRPWDPEGTSYLRREFLRIARKLARAGQLRALLDDVEEIAEGERE